MIVTVDDASFFKALPDKVRILSPSFRSEVEKHLSYLALKSGASVEQITQGVPFEVSEYQIVVDAIQNISAVVGKDGQSIAQSWLGAEDDDAIAAASSMLEGWCTREKAIAIQKLIRSYRPLICIEIGVYGGRSLIPAAVALRQNGAGVIYGIEAWQSEIAIEHYTTTENDEWWKRADFDTLKYKFLKFIVEYNLTKQAKIIEARSADAAGMFSSIDYLHIDGGHSIYNACEDVILYLRKVKRGGIIIMDDAEWPSTAPAISILDSFCDRIDTLDNDRGVRSCIVYRKNKA